jgi:hypothetical protein
MGFFEFTHRFFDRISIIDQKMPNLPQFQRCVLRVFSSLLKICAVAQQYSSEKRMSRFFLRGYTVESSTMHLSDMQLRCPNREMVRRLVEGHRWGARWSHRGAGGGCG